MNENLNHFTTEGVRRRSVVKAAAWAAPVIATAVAVPAVSASTEPEEATSLGATTTSPRVGNTGIIRPFGLAPDGSDGVLPEGQTFTLTSSDLDFDTIIQSISNGTITRTGDGTWLITPAPGATSVDIRFVSDQQGSYTLTSNGPADPGQSWGGTVLA